MKRFLTLLLAVPALYAQSGSVQVFVSNGVRPILEAVTGQAEKTGGKSISYQFGTTTVLRERIAKGEAFDAAILTSDVITALVSDKKLSGATRVDIARAGIGVGVRSGAAKPDIKTADALKKTLLNAKSITFASAGASAPHLQKMFERMGIADAIKPKLNLEADSVHANMRVAGGQSDIIMTLVSEIIGVKGVDLVGPLPAEYQNYVSFAGAVSPGSKNEAAAKTLLSLLAGPAAEAPLKAAGMERPGK